MITLNIDDKEAVRDSRLLTEQVTKRLTGQNVPWILADALEEIRRVQSGLHAYGYHMGLCGGVLNAGSSIKDLDVTLMPMQTSAPDINRALKHLEAFGWEGMRNADEYDRNPVTHGHIFKCRIGTRAVDLFVWGKL